MRAFTWTLVAVLALGALGCEQKREEESLPAIDPAELEATAPPTEAMPARPADTWNTATTPAVEVETPSSVPPAAPVTPVTPAVGAQTYTMQAGDTLYGLARRFYGDGKLWPRIVDANQGQIRDITAIPVGTVLRIPPK